MMSAFKLDATLTKDGMLTLSDLPFHAGDSVEVIIVPRAIEFPSNGYPLRGKVRHYERPTEPVAEDDWEAQQ